MKMPISKIENGYEDYKNLKKDIKNIKNSFWYKLFGGK